MTLNYLHITVKTYRESLAFATEPVLCSLANILGKLENTPQPIPKDLQEYKLFEIDIKYGLMQLGQGLAFLHNDAKLLHHNLCSENVVINEQGAWKIFGFDFGSHCINHADPNVRVKLFNWFRILKKNIIFCLSNSPNGLHGSIK